MPLLKRKPVEGYYSEIDQVSHDDFRFIFERPDPDAHLAPVPDHEIDELLTGLLESEGDQFSNEVTKPAAISKKSASNEVTAPKRGTDARAKQIIEEIREIRVVYDDDGKPSLVENSTPLFSTTDYGDAGDRTTLTFANEALELLASEESGTRPVSWSLNLSPDRQNEALSHPKGFTRCMEGLIIRRLEKLLGSVPPLWFGVHVKAGRLHLHGGILIAPKDYAAVADALIYAGGEWDHRRGQDRQLDLNPHRCDDGWVDYVLRERAAARRMIGDHHFYIAKGLRREAGWLYGQYRDITAKISAGL